MPCQMRVIPLVAVIATIAVIIKADGSGRDLVSLNAPFRQPRPRSSFLLDQLFIDKITDQHGSTIPPARDHQSIGRQVPHVFSKDRVSHPSGFPIYHRQPFKQTTPFALNAPKEGASSLTRNQPATREQRAILQDNPFDGQSASFASPSGILGEIRAHKTTRAPFKQQLFTAEMPLGNLFHGQSPSGERVSFQKQAALDYPALSDAMKLYRHDPYGKTIDSYGRTRKDARTMSIFTEYDSDTDFRLPMIWPSENLLPLNSETPIVVDESGFSMSAVSSGNDGIHSSEAFKMKLGPTSDSAPSMHVDGNCNALVDNSPSGMSSGAATTVPSISVSANQSSIVGHILTSLTTKPSSPVTVTATPIKPFVGNALDPIYFHATKHGAVTVTPSASLENRPKSDMSGVYSLAQAPASDERTVKYLVPEVARNNPKTDTRSPIPSYIHGQEFKGSNVQNSLANSLGLKYGGDWSLQQFSQPDTSPSNYPSLSLDGKTSLELVPSVPVVPISAISWPVKSESDVSAILPAKPITMSDATSDNLPLGLTLQQFARFVAGMNIPLDLMASMPSSLTPSASNGISGSITAGISTAMPDGTAADMPASIPTLKLGQSLHRAEQLQRSQEARNPWYPAGLQLQLGGFGGINYTLRTSNQVARPTEHPGSRKRA